MKYLSQVQAQILTFPDESQFSFVWKGIDSAGINILIHQVFPMPSKHRLFLSIFEINYYIYIYILETLFFGFV